MRKKKKKKKKNCASMGIMLICNGEAISVSYCISFTLRSGESLSWLLLYHYFSRETLQRLDEVCYCSNIYLICRCSKWVMGCVKSFLEDLSSQSFYLFIFLH